MGPRKSLSYLAEALARGGAEVTVLTSRAPGMKDLPRHEQEPIPGAARARGCGRLTVVRLATSRLRFVGTWLYMRNLARWFAAHPVDLAYVSMLKHDAYVAVEAGQRQGFPVVLRPEGAGATGDLAWQAWAASDGRSVTAASRPMHLLPSREIAPELSEGGYEPARIGEFFPTGCRCRRVPGSAGQAGGRAINVFVGRLAPEKGLRTLIDAWPAVRTAHPGARLTLIGEGPERPALAVQARSLGLTLGPDQAVEIPARGGPYDRSLTGRRPVCLAIEGRGNEHRLVGGDGSGNPAGRLVDPGQPPPGQRLQDGRLAAPEDP